MAEKLDPKEIVTLDELAISNMWENAALLKAWEAEDAARQRDATRRRSRHPCL